MTIQIDENIRLDLVDDKHSQSIFDLVSKNRNYLREWLNWVDYMQTVDFIKSFINGSKQRNHNGSEFAFVIIENEIVVGRIGVYKIDNQNKIGEIGYWVGENFQGKGIVATSCKGLLSFCFNELNLNRIEIKCGTENYKSQTIPKRLNFEKEGIIRQGELVNNRFIDLNFYSLLKNDWK